MNPSVFKWLLSGIAMTPLMAQAADLRIIGSQPATGSAAAVIVGDVPLVHTAQVFPIDSKGRLVSTQPLAQVVAALDVLSLHLADAGSDLPRIVKLNVYVSQQSLVGMMQEHLAERFSGIHQPAVSWVLTKLPVDGALVAVDAVATTERSSKAVQFAKQSQPNWGIIPSGTRIYVAGQAEPGPTLREATQKTLLSLQNTLKFLGRSDADIVQLKAFLNPMSDAEQVRNTIAEFYSGGLVPPIVMVEWIASPSIEIELVAWGGRDNQGPAVEYLTPPFLKSSPVFSRVARINSTSSIYTSGLYASAPGEKLEVDGNTPAAGEREVKDVFRRLEVLLKECGSDLRHLVKATYYCASDVTSKKLTELRPQYYDPQRPPSASKAIVAGTGRAGLGLTIDMIAVPSASSAE